ncbi:CMRF35-like molecule 8 [Brachyhypopomus gauderio]|uniref:CMRF35-like molecule 8 n=1 Tax=Brachyhypopomus gauderio TaxID=698409 RepID=UPI004041F9B5
MKILLIFSLCLISVGSFDVNAYSGGSVIIFSAIQGDLSNRNEFCKVTQNTCINVMKDSPGGNRVYNRRFNLYKNSKGLMTVMINDLNFQDTGKYRFRVNNQHLQNVKLKVQKNACCLGSQNVSGREGDSENINCDYPKKYKNRYKYLFKLGGHPPEERCSTEVGCQNNRLSIYDDRESMFNVKIRKVTVGDAGLYLCGIKTNRNQGSFISTVKRVQLHVTASTTNNNIPSTMQPVTTATDKNPDTSQPGSSVFIIACVCVALLLIGVLGLMLYKFTHMKAQALISPQISHTYTEYEEIKDDKPYSTVQLPTIPSVPPNTVYALAELPTVIS